MGKIFIAVHNVKVRGLLICPYKTSAVPHSRQTSIDTIHNGGYEEIEFPILVTQTLAFVQ